MCFLLFVTPSNGHTHKRSYYAAYTLRKNPKKIGITKNFTNSSRRRMSGHRKETSKQTTEQTYTPLTMIDNGSEFATTFPCMHTVMIMMGHISPFGFLHCLWQSLPQILARVTVLFYLLGRIIGLRVWIGVLQNDLCPF
jgi:hypothetical protein